MKSWKQTEIHLGDLKVGQKTKVQFSRGFLGREIEDIKVSCSCVGKPDYDKKAQTITVYYTPGNIPRHLVTQGSYFSTKFILLTYEGGETEKLSFTATVYK